MTFTQEFKEDEEVGKSVLVDRCAIITIRTRIKIVSNPFDDAIEFVIVASF